MRELRDSVDAKPQNIAPKIKDLMREKILEKNDKGEYS
jgi:predicted transcriptional regulator